MNLPFWSAGYARLRLVPALVLALIGASCTDAPVPGPLDPGDPTEPVTDPAGMPPLGVYEFSVSGIGTPDLGAGPVEYPVAADLSVVGDSALEFELASVTSFVDGPRDADGQRYITLHYRVRNASGSALSNITLIPNTTSGTIPNTPWISLRRFDGTDAPDSLAERIVPTGAVTLGEDMELSSLYPDVLQVFEEAEIDTLTMPAGVTGLFPYGFMVRSRDMDAADRTIQPAQDADDFGGVLTFSFRFPLTASNSTDPFSFTFWAAAYEDDEVRLTESIEEAADTAAVRRLRERATLLGATTTTVLAGSLAPLDTVADYPGQRRVCSVRTAGTAVSPITYITEPAALARYVMLRPGETVDACEPGFRTGTPDRPATGVAFPLTVTAMDRYGNVKTAANETVRIEQDSGPPITIGADAALSSGQAQIAVTYGDYGTSTLRAVGSRQRGWQALDIFGVTRVWTGAAGTDWANGGSWSMGAVPLDQDTVIIPDSAAVDPLLTGAVAIAGVSVEDSAALDLATYDLSVTGDVATGVTGGITSTTGVLQLLGDGNATDLIGVIPTTRVTGYYVLSGNVVATAPVLVEGGRLQNSTYTVQILP